MSDSLIHEKREEQQNDTKLLKRKPDLENIRTSEIVVIERKETKN